MIARDLEFYRMLESVLIDDTKLFNDKLKGQGKISIITTGRMLH